MLNWLQAFGTFCFLDNNNYNVAPHQYECLAAAGVQHFIAGDNLLALDKFLQNRQWVFGHLAYHLSATIHGITSVKKEGLGFAPYYFFSPQVVVEIKNDSADIYADDPDAIFKEICQQVTRKLTDTAAVEAKPALTKEAYIKKIHRLQQHILRGDCYEINFCQEFFAEGVDFNPFAGYQKLAALSPNPFSAFYKIDDKYLLCASPERYLQKKGTRLLSQPIKGTSRRNPGNDKEDNLLKEALRSSKKDQSENVMIVDLVRNDFTRICKGASVKVEELYGIYTYPQVHQMISTISGEMEEKNIPFSKIIEATFPMGSMTGAPKYRVMQLIEEYEPASRGIFSGAVGYFNPHDDFDFNVVIRSLMYNSTQRYLSYQVGSGITFYSDAEKEWEECLLKAAAIKQVLEG